MGRPLRRDINGIEVFGAYTGDAGIRCEAYIAGSNKNDVYVVKQRGVRTYLVHGVTDGLDVKARLVVGTPAADGEMRLTAYVDGADTPVYLSKLTKKVATSFAGTLYHWSLTNYQDSTADQIKLTPFV